MMQFDRHLPSSLLHLSSCISEVHVWCSADDMDNLQASMVIVTGVRPLKLELLLVPLIQYFRTA